MKRILMALIIVLPALKLSAQTLAQAYGVDAEQLGAQFFQEGRREMSKEEEEKLLSKLSKDMRAKLEEVKKLNKEKYQQMLRSSAFSYGGFSEVFAPEVEFASLKGISENYKKEKELEVDTELLALKCKNADEGSQQKLKNELSAKLSELFDIKEAKKQSELKRLEKKIQELKESLQARKQNKQDIVNRRIQEMVGDAKYLKWD
jgi:hypothetical protein